MLQDLHSFAHRMFQGDITGHWVSNLPIGFGKSTKFLVPFVADAVMSRTKGILVAVQRRDQAETMTTLINEEARKFDSHTDDIAFALLGMEAPFAKEEQQRFTQDKGTAKQYPVIVITHSLLANQTAQKPFYKWARGKRVMIICDEKPGLYFHFDQATKEEFQQDNPRKAVRSVRNGIDAGESTIAQGDENNFRTLYRKPFPSLPLLILDGTAKEDDPFYSYYGVKPVRTRPIVHLHEKRVILETWDMSIGKTTTLTDGRVEALINDVQRILALTPHGRVFVIGALAHEERMVKALGEQLSTEQLSRLAIKHYGQVQGTNDLSDTVAVVCFSTPFKPPALYRLTGGQQKPDVVKEFVQQTIGRTAIRNDKPCTIRMIIPWADEQGVKLLKEEMEQQWGATVEHIPLSRKPPKESRSKRLAKVVEIVTRRGSIRRDDLVSELGMSSRDTFRKWLDKHMDMLNKMGIYKQGHTLTTRNLLRQAA